MKADFNTLQDKPKLGTGIYTMPDIALILGIPYSKVNRWINKFWNDKLGQQFEKTYSWNVDLTKAVNFYTLVELFVFYEISKAGVRPQKILEAHQILSKHYKTPYPFAFKKVLENIKTDGKKIFLEEKDGSIFSLDIHRQFNLGFIKDFCKNLDFDGNSLVYRYWPLGKGRTILCDPHHQFGQPVINGTNITAEALNDMYLAGEPAWFIADIFHIKESNVVDAIEFCKKAA